MQRHQVLGDGVRVEVRAPLGVHLDQGVRHQGVVGDVPVALVVRRDGRARRASPRTTAPTMPVTRPAVPLLDLLRGPALGRRRPARPRRRRRRARPTALSSNQLTVAHFVVLLGTRGCVVGGGRAPRPLRGRYYVIAPSRSSAGRQLRLRRSRSRQVPLVRRGRDRVLPLRVGVGLQDTAPPSKFSPEASDLRPSRSRHRAWLGERSPAADAVAGISASASFSAARFSVCMKKLMNSADSSTCSRVDVDRQRLRVGRLLGALGARQRRQRDPVEALRGVAW